MRGSVQICEKREIAHIKEDVRRGNKRSSKIARRARERLMPQGDARRCANLRKREIAHIEEDVRRGNKRSSKIARRARERSMPQGDARRCANL
ncbi:hypothetical protein QJS04_geneDACA006661 [Acorus gramineus]|uniref:Uncharacterized protein n=1 Tax=Acorus gramineus TaxID=55184 RepID=A0AAV9AY46_ACOGR|nr:hypothetical protein QJS04_geneDACA006661 [Acorus gramineus]